MNTPALPEVFGNYALGDNFTEVTAASTIDWWPQTPGWWVLAMLAGLLVLRYLLRLWRRWYHNRYRREALRALDQLKSSAPDNLPAALSELLKRTTLAAFPRHQVARLHGQAWVHFLNQRCETALFVDELARELTQGQYQENTPFSECERDALIRACRQWLKTHQGPTDA